MKNLVFTVVYHGSEKFFKLNDGGTTLLLDKILSTWFEGYRRCTKCIITRNGELYDSGRVNYYGTQAAMEYFFDWKKIADKNPTIAIKANNLEVGDILEIENTQENNARCYWDANAFISLIAISQKYVDPILRKALKKAEQEVDEGPQKNLRNDLFSEAMAESRAQELKKIATKTFLVLVKR
jgi:hypothetical protein